MSLTPSAGPRVEKCLGSAVLMQVDEEHEGTERGKALHAFLAALALGKTPAEALTLCPEDWRKDAEAIEVPEDITSGRPEVGLALDSDAGTARVLGEDMTREQVRNARMPHETGMVLDWVSIQGDLVIVADHKFGWQEDLAPAAEHLQLLVYAATALLAWGKEVARGELRHWDGVRWRLDSVALDFVGALEVLERWRSLRNRVHDARNAYEVRGAVPRFSIGKWCAWCPAQRACPAQVSAALAVLGAGDPAGKPLEMTPAQAGEAWERFRLIETWAEKYRKGIEAMADKVQIPLSSGEVLRAQEVVKASPDPELAASWLAQRFGPEVAQTATVTKVSMSWEGINDAVRAHVLPAAEQAWRDGRGKKPSMASIAREVREALKATGAVRVTGYVQVKPVWPELPAETEPGTAG